MWVLQVHTFASTTIALASTSVSPLLMILNVGAFCEDQDTRSPQGE